MLFFVWYAVGMAIRLKKESEGVEGRKIKITLTNGHCDHIENVRKKFGLGNQAQALDFVLKAVGETDDSAETLSVGGIEYTPDGYDK